MRRGGHQGGPRYKADPAVNAPGESWEEVRDRRLRGIPPGRQSSWGVHESTPASHWRRGLRPQRFWPALHKAEQLSVASQEALRQGGATQAIGSGQGCVVWSGPDG